MIKIISKIIIKSRNIIIYRILNKTTKGVRVILKNGNKILLIKHPYDNFWVLPGGGIKKQEENVTAAIRETEEETGYKLKKPLKKLGEYKNFSNNKKDFVSVYLSEYFEKPKLKTRSFEIQKIQWFDFNKLPKTSKATERRLLEVFKKDFQLEIRDW